MVDWKMMGEDERSRTELKILQRLTETDFSVLYERRFHRGYYCVHCGSTHLHRHGRYRNRQRFRCVDCGRTFNEHTNTPLDGTHYPEKWPAFLYCLAQGYSLRHCARLLGLSLPTVFAWRHKVLAALRQGTMDVLLDGIIELDEVYVLEAQKGCRHLDRPPRRRGTGHFVSRGLAHPNRFCVLAARDRKERTHVTVLGRGQPGVFVLERALAAIDFRGTVLCVDNRQAYWSLARRHRLQRERFAHPSQRRGLFHMRRIDRFLTRFRQWQRRFNGISTCYLSHYLGWFVRHDRGAEVGAQALQLGWTWLLFLFDVDEKSH